MKKLFIIFSVLNSDELIIKLIFEIHDLSSCLIRDYNIHSETSNDDDWSNLNGKNPPIQLLLISWSNTLYWRGNPIQSISIKSVLMQEEFITMMQKIPMTAVLRSSYPSSDRKLVQKQSSQRKGLRKDMRVQARYF